MCLLGVLCRVVVFLVQCPGPLGSCSPVWPFLVLCRVSGVLGHLAAVHRCARPLFCVACALFWASWLLFTGVLAWCVALRACGVLGHLAPVHRCAHSVCIFACAVSWATWLLFTGVLARCVKLRVCNVLGHLAPVRRCACSVFCVVCAWSWATPLLFTSVPARCVVLRVRCLGPLGSCSPVCSLAVLCCVRSVLGRLAPVHRCACGVCCAVCCVCGVACAELSCGARTRPSGRQLFVARRGWVPSGRAHVHADGSCFVSGRGWVPSGRAHVHPNGGCFVSSRGWVRCLVRTRPSGRQLVLPGTCSGAMVRCVLCALSRFAAAGGRCCLAAVRVPWLWLAACFSCVPRGPACRAAPRLVRSLSVLQLAFPTRWCLSPARGLSPPELLGGSARHAEAGQGPGSLCLPLTPAEAGALTWLCTVPVPGPPMGLSLAGPFGVGLWLRALRSLACVDPVTDTSGFPYRPSFDEGPSRCTGAVSCGRCHLPLRVGGRHAQVPCVCSSFLAGSGGPASRARFGAPHLSFGRFVLLRCSAPFRLGLPLFCPFVGLLALLCCFFFFPLCAPPLSLAFSDSGPGCPGPWRPVALPPLFFLARCVFLFVSSRSLFLFRPTPPFFLFSTLFVRPRCLMLTLVPAPGLVGLGAVWSFPPPPLPFSFPVARLFFCLFPPALLLLSRPHPPPFFWRFSSPPPGVCLVGLPLFRSLCSPTWPLAAPPPPALVCVLQLSPLPLGALCLPSNVVLVSACLASVGVARPLQPPPPPPSAVRVLPCAVWCRRVLLPFRLMFCGSLVFCGAVLQCSVLRVALWCRALLCCGLLSAVRCSFGRSCPC